MCDQNGYQQSFEPCEMSCMPEGYSSMIDCRSYQLQDTGRGYEQEESQFPPNCNKCTPQARPQSSSHQHGYYDCPENSFSMRDQECTGFCDAECFQNDQKAHQDFCDTLKPCIMQAGDFRPCSDSCQVPLCSPFKKRRYVQPPRRLSFRPAASYSKPSLPMATDTIYRKSFEPIDKQTATCCRPQAFNGGGFLTLPSGPFEKNTVTKMSFQPFCGSERRQPYRPSQAALMGRGPMQSLTTQKHDFVPKFQYRRALYEPRDNMSKSCGNIEGCTVQRLSYQAPCGFSRPKSFRPVSNYRKPDVPMEFETTSKLSFMPVCPQPKEDLPWAKKSSYMTPTLPFANDTITKLSYQAPGCFIDDYCEMPCSAD